MNRKWWIALVLVLSVTVVAGVSTLAQDDGSGGPGGGPGGGGPGGRSGRQGGMGGGGGAAMVVHGNFIFVLMGPKLIKIDPNEMKTVGELDLGGGAGAKKGPGGGGPGGGEPK